MSINVFGTHVQFNLHVLDRAASEQRTITKCLFDQRNSESPGLSPRPHWETQLPMVFLKQPAAAIWACDFLCVRTVFFQTLYVFFVVDHCSCSKMYLALELGDG
jgi:hypothetical protein